MLSKQNRTGNLLQLPDEFFLRKCYTLTDHFIHLSPNILIFGCDLRILKYLSSELEVCYTKTPLTY